MAITNLWNCLNCLLVVLPLVVSTQRSVMSGNSQTTDEPFNSCDYSTTQSTTALALVPYDDLKISDFHRPERLFNFGNEQIAIGQNWRELGVAAVVWDAVFISPFVIEIIIFPFIKKVKKLILKFI